jgi:hypothetical protein
MYEWTNGNGLQERTIKVLKVNESCYTVLNYGCVHNVETGFFDKHSRALTEDEKVDLL